MSVRNTRTEQLVKSIIAQIYFITRRNKVDKVTLNISFISLFCLFFAKNLKRILRIHQEKNKTKLIVFKQVNLLDLRKFINSYISKFMEQY